MTEGELKKRTHNEKSQMFTDYVLIDTIEELVDEMKKDFAELIHADDPLYWIYHTGELRNEFLKKFNRWLGIMESKQVEELPSPEWTGDSS